MAVQSIGVFDSGVGGLSVLREVRALLPAQSVIYFGDQAHVPYGARSLEEVRAFSHSVVNFLLGQGAGMIVVACNTASAAALHSLREAFPGSPSWAWSLRSSPLPSRPALAWWGYWRLWPPSRGHSTLR